MLHRIGVGPADVLFVHSHVPVLGIIEGGVATILDVFTEVLGPKGTLVLPTFTLGYTSTRQFDLQRTPSEVGVLTEAFRNYPGVLRSLHPVHSVAAAGQHAKWITSGFCRSSFGEDSAYDRLYDLDARFLCLGVDARYLTFLHYIEEQRQVRYRFYKEFPGEVRADDEVCPETFSMYVRDLRFENDFRRIDRVLEGENLVSTAELAYGQVRLYKAKKTFESVTSLLDADPWVLLAEDAPIHELL